MVRVHSRREIPLSMDSSIEEGRAASKSPHLKFGYFLSLSQQAVSAGIIQNSAAEIFTSKIEETKTKQVGY